MTIRNADSVIVGEQARPARQGRLLVNDSSRGVAGASWEVAPSRVQDTARRVPARREHTAWRVLGVALGRNLSGERISSSPYWPAGAVLGYDGDAFRWENRGVYISNRRRDLRKSMILLLTLCLSATALAQSEETPPPPAPKPDVKTVEPKRDPKAIEILKRANVATPKVKSLMYTATYVVEGANPPRLRMPDGIRMTGSFTVAAGEDGAPPKFRCEAKYTSDDSKKAQEVLFGGDGELFFFIDPTTKTVYEDLDPVVLGPRAAIAVRGLRLREFLFPAPFDDEISAMTVELGSDRTIGDAACYEIRVDYRREGQVAYWYFGKKDHLPRGVRRFASRPRGRSARSADLRRPDPAHPRRLHARPGLRERPEIGRASCRERV